MAIALGAISALGQAPFGWWAATLVALAGLFVLATWPDDRDRAFWTGWGGGIGYFALALVWIVEPFLIDIARHGWMAPFALVLMAGGLGLFWALAFRLAAGRGVWALALALTVAEALRGVIFTGFPWAQLGHVWTATSVAQLAAYAGPLGLIAVTTLAAAGLAVRDRRRTLATVVALAGLWGAGQWRLAQPLPDARAVTLRLVQPNAAQSAKWDEAEAMAFLERQLGFSSATPHADLVIWPETAVPFTFEISPGLLSTIAEAGMGAPVALGIQRIDGDRGWNSLRVVMPDGKLGPSYDKHHLVPFGEYVPFGDLAYSLFGITAFAAQTGRTYSAGVGPAVLDLGPKLGRVLPLICYEVVFSGIPRRAPERADWMLQITNDAWFGTWSGPFQHAEQARLRAIEQGLPLVRVANTGVTAVFDARGQVTADLDFGVASYLDAGLPGALPPTPYARWGDWPVLAGMLCGLLALMRRRRDPVA